MRTLHSRMYSCSVFRLALFTPNEPYLRSATNMRSEEPFCQKDLKHCWKQVLCCLHKMYARVGSIFLLICAATSAYYVAKDECPENEEYLLCGSACPYNCTNPQETVICTDDCIEGCFCKSGYLKNETGTCVPIEECVRSSAPICEDNEEFMSCGSACPATCSKPKPLVCTLQCSIGCFCKSGYYRDEATNKCVTIDKCSIQPCADKNEEYSMCNAGCQSSCSDPDPICTNICAAGCVCSPGLLRGSDGICVSVDKCQTNATITGPLSKYLNAITKILHLSYA